MVRALASLQCGVGSNPSFPAPYVGWVCCWFSLLLLEVFLQVLLFCRILKIQFCFLEHKDTFERPLKNSKVPRAFRVNKFIIFFLKKSQFTNTTKYTQLLLPLTLGRRCKFIPPPWYKGVGVWMEPHPGVFEMLQYFETILPLVESL